MTLLAALGIDILAALCLFFAGIMFLASAGARLSARLAWIGIGLVAMAAAVGGLGLPAVYVLGFSTALVALVWFFAGSGPR